MKLRPAVIFLGLFLLLMLAYRLLAPRIGAGGTFIAQSLIVLALVIALTWYRRRRNDR